MDVALLIQCLNDSQNYEESSMPRCGTTFDENREESPPWIRRGTAARRAAVGVVRSVADEHGTPTTPAVAVGHSIPSSTQEGTFFSGGAAVMKGARRARGRVRRQGRFSLCCLVRMIVPDKLAERKELHE